MDDGIDVFSYYGENGLICGIVGRAVLSVGPSREKLQKYGARGTAMASIAKAFDMLARARLCMRSAYSG